MKSTGKKSTALIAVVAVLAVVVLVAAAAAAFFLWRRHKRKSKNNYRQENGVGERRRGFDIALSAIKTNRPHNSRNQGIEMAGGRPAISGPFNRQKLGVPDYWNDAKDALHAEKRREREAGEAMKNHVPRSAAEANKVTEPEAAYTRPAGMRNGDPAGRRLGEVVRDGIYTEAGPGPSSMAYHTGGLSRSASERETGWGSVPYRAAGPDFTSMGTRGNAGLGRGESFDHFGGANPYLSKQGNGSSAFSTFSDNSEKERERKRDKLAQGAKKVFMLGRKDSKKSKGAG